MSVVIVAHERYETIRKTMRHLRGQTARERLEVLIVTGSKGELGPLDGELEGFGQAHVIECATETHWEARAAGARAASAPVVVFAEDHSFPDPGWAEALIEAHRQPWAAVGPLLGNANPASMLSWADIFLNFAPWIAPRAKAGAVAGLPWHNTSYKTAILRDYGSALGTMLCAEGILQQDLRARGYQLYLEPQARTDHINFSKFIYFVQDQYYGRRTYAALRAREGRWSVWRRAAYVVSWPLIPVLLFRRLLPNLLRPGQPIRLLPRMFPALALGLVVGATGEVMGYAFGAGNAPHRKNILEFDRMRYVTEHDQRALADWELEGSQSEPSYTSREHSHPRA
jgi:hypothetical protein